MKGRGARQSVNTTTPWSGRARLALLLGTIISVSQCPAAYYITCLYAKDGPVVQGCVDTAHAAFIITSWTDTSAAKNSWVPRTDQLPLIAGH